MSYIFAYAFAVSPYVYPPPTYSFINTQVPIFSISLFDQTLITGPIELDVYLYDLSYIGSPTPNVSLYDLSYIGSPTPNVSLYDLSYINSPTPNVSLYDLSYINSLTPNLSLYDLSYVYKIPSDIPIVYIIDTSYIGSYPA